MAIKARTILDGKKVLHNLPKERVVFKTYVGPGMQYELSLLVEQDGDDLRFDLRLFDDSLGGSSEITRGIIAHDGWHYIASNKDWE